VARMSTLSEKLDHLFRTVHPADRGEYSHQEVADGVHRLGGPTISASYVWQLRRGDRDNPTMRHLEALAAFFGVPPAYFFDEDEAAAQAIRSELELLAALRDAGVRRIALRAVGLPPKSLLSVEQMIDLVRGLSGLDGEARVGAAGQSELAEPAEPADPIAAAAADPA
jgi:transcriptional regulator with XRE-family HTH domain